MPKSVIIGGVIGGLLDIVAEFQNVDYRAQQMQFPVVASNIMFIRQVFIKYAFFNSSDDYYETS